MKIIDSMSAAGEMLNSFIKVLPHVLARGGAARPHSGAAAARGGCEPTVLERFKEDY